MRRALVFLLLLACDPPLRPESDQTARAVGALGVLADGAAVVSRRGDAPGETDLWIVPKSGEARPLAPAPGADDLPTILPDGRVAFVSNRTTVASIWIADPKTGTAVQLTNRGLAAGRELTGFVPTPMKRMAVEGGALVYESSPGRWWSIDLTTGAAREIAR